MRAIQKPSLTLRIGIGKLVGFVIGILGVGLFSMIGVPPSWAFGCGFVLWYATIGAIVGIYGVYSHHPILKFPLPWWLRSSIIGGWMNFVLALFIYEDLTRLFGQLVGSASVTAASIGFMIEGAVVGLLIGWIATALGGEGPGTVLQE